MVGYQLDDGAQIMAHVPGGNLRGPSPPQCHLPEGFTWMSRWKLIKAYFNSFNSYTSLRKGRQWFMVIDLS